LSFCATEEEEGDEGSWAVRDRGESVGATGVPSLALLNAAICEETEVEEAEA
jgi:hypothetical protein